MLQARLLTRIVVVSLLLFVGITMFQPVAPQASAYPTALDNPNAPAAFSEGCLWGLICNGGPHGHCGLINDPDIGCARKADGTCTFSCAM